MGIIRVYKGRLGGKPKDPRRYRPDGKLRSEYWAWGAMKQRCLNENCPDWPRYGGRGITVCQRWRDSYYAFYEDMGPKPTPRHSIDRIDPYGNYEPDNCRWATPSEQNRNFRGPDGSQIIG